MFEPLNYAEQAAMDRFRAVTARQGYKDWKECLGVAWASGCDASFPDHGHTLRRMRNTRGPEWLAQFEVTP